MFGRRWIGFLTPSTKVSLPTRSKRIVLTELERNIDYTATAWVLVCRLDGLQRVEPSKTKDTLLRSLPRSRSLR